MVTVAASWREISAIEPSGWMYQNDEMADDEASGKKTPRLCIVKIMDIETTCYVVDYWVIWV